MQWPLITLINNKSQFLKKRKNYEANKHNLSHQAISLCYLLQVDFRIDLIIEEQQNKNIATYA